MSFRVIFVEEMRVVGANELHAVLFCQVDEDGIDALLNLEGLSIGNLCRVGHFVTLQLEVIVVTPNVVEPLDGFFCSGKVAVRYFLWHFATDAGRADDEAFVELLQVLVVSTGSPVKAVHPRARDELDEVVIALEVLGENDKMPTRLDFLTAFVHILVAVPCHIHFAAEDGLEWLFSVLYPLLIDLLAAVVKLFNAIHIAVVGKCHAAHAVLDGLIHHALDGRLPVEQGVLRVDV